MRAKLVGLPEALEGLAGLSDAVQRRISVVASSAAGGVFKDEAVKRAPKETRTLEKNIIVKTKLNKNKKSAYSLVGARRGVKVAVSTKDNKTKVVARYRKKKDGSIAVSGQKRLDKLTASGKKHAYRVPSRYIHLAEDRNKSHFLKRTIAAKSGAATEKAIQKVDAGIKAEAAKSLAKSKR